MSRSYAQTPLGPKRILIADNPRYSKAFWSETIRNKIIEKAKLPLPNCLRPYGKKEFFLAITTKWFQSFSDENKCRFVASIADRGDDYKQLWDNFFSADLWRHSARSCNCNPIHLALAICDLMDQKPEYFFEDFPIDASGLTPFRKWRFGSVPPPLPCFTVDGLPYTPTGTDILYDHNWQWRATVTRYSGSGENIFAYTSRVTDGDSIDYASVGEIAPPALLYGRESLADNSACPVLLSLNPDVSMALRKTLQEMRMEFAQNFKLLANYGSLDALYLGDICGRDVILLCSPDRGEWAESASSSRRCLDSGANSVRIYPYPICGDFCSFGNRAMPAEAKERLFSRTTDLGECERVSLFVKRIIEDSFPVEKLDAFEKSWNLIQEETGKVSLAESSIQFQSWRDFDEADASHDGPLATRDLINSANNTLIYGQSDVGKSWLIIALCIALASGSEIFGLAASEPAKVFYLDGEVGNDFGRRIRQLCQGKSDTFMRLLDKNLLVRSFADSDEILGKKAQFLSLLSKEQPDILVIDNILSLAPQAWRGKSEYLFDFLREIKAMGIAPIIVHHTGKKGDTFLGSVSLGALSQNVIRLENLRPQND